MALSVERMKHAIQQSLKTEAATALAANKQFGDAVIKNLCDDMEITYAWSGSTPSPGSTIDPAVICSAKVSGNGTLTPSASFGEMLLKLGTLIKGLTISAAAGFTVGPLSFNPLGVITVVMVEEDTQEAAMDHFCTQLIASLIANFPNPAPAPGSHGPYSGSASNMVIA